VFYRQSKRCRYGGSNEVRENNSYWGHGVQPAPIALEHFVGQSPSQNTTIDHRPGFDLTVTLHQN
jgi:hypothetical protein